ncbi:MAG: GNAT family N-acetyltransferase [Chlorobi bacterium]|nr:GNAT family N-acetyltransferase [Chlorobiota bacterium]
MNIFFSEAPPDYATYTFPYAVYAVLTPGDTPSEVYARGFLPYSDHRRIPPGVRMCYLARSVRVDTSRFSLTSENRRIRKKTEPLDLRYELVDKADISPEEMTPLIEAYTRVRMPGVMPPERLKYIYDFDWFNRVAVFRSQNRPVGYVWLVDRPDMRHYWFAFFQPDLIRTGLGKRMMETLISDAAERHIPHVYLGTCYGPKALYKVRDFRGVEYFDGNGWTSDLNRLKARCKGEENSGADEFKLHPRYFISASKGSDL